MKEINVNGQKRTDTGKKAYPAICMVRRRVRTVCPKHLLSLPQWLSCARLSTLHTYML